MNMEPVTGCPLGMSGKSLQNTGESSLANAFTIPPFSPTFIMPSHSERTPVSPRDISKAVFDDSNVDPIISGNTSKSPMKINFTNAMTKAMTKNAIQM